MADDTYSRGYRNDPAGRGGAAGPAVDPLTELARLIGQSDPFAAVEPRRPNPRPAEPNRQPADWQAEPPRHDQGQDRDQDRGQDRDHDQGYDRDHDRGHDAAHDHALDHYDDRAAQDARYGADRRDFPPEYDRQDDQAPADQGYYDDPHDGYPEQAYEDYRGGAPHEDMGGYAADPHGEHPDDPSRFYDDEPPPPRRRGWMLTAAGLIGLAIVGAAAAVAYQKVFREGAPSIITRDPGPNKIIPSSQNADGRTNKRVDRIATGAPDERMVSREEQPVALPDTTRSAPGFGQGAGGVPLTAPSPPPADTGSAGAPDAGPAPRKIQTVRVPPDAPTAVAVAPRQPPSRAATAAQAPSQSAPLPIAPQAPPPSPQGGPLSLSPQSQVATAAPPPRAAARAPATAAAEAGSGYYVQLTAQRSEEEAQSSFHGIQAKYENLLGAHQPVIRRKDLGAKGIFFAAQVGPFSRESAVGLCESLKSAGASCMLQKN